MKPRFARSAIPRKLFASNEPKHDSLLRINRNPSLEDISMKLQVSLTRSWSVSNLEYQWKQLKSKRTG